VDSGYDWRCCFLFGCGFGWGHNSDKRGILPFSIEFCQNSGDIAANIAALLNIAALGAGSVETKILQLRAEFFNLANTPQFNNPATTFGPTVANTPGLDPSKASAFGTISSAASESTFQRTERQVQFAAKITF